jgi:predicted DNA-binding protein (MmcQ/YjbR family)
MNAEDFRAYCLGKSAATEGTPFGPEDIVFKVGGKMFALLAFEEVPPKANLKCDPDLALELRDRYEQVEPGYHMNKKHWNTVVLDGVIPDKELCEMIDHSYDLVAGSLPKRVKAPAPAPRRRRA